MPTPTRYRFCFGPWNISEGTDPFGPNLREAYPLARKYALYKPMDFGSVQIHDNDVVLSLEQLTAPQIASATASAPTSATACAAGGDQGGPPRDARIIQRSGLGRQCSRIVSQLGSCIRRGFRAIACMAVVAAQAAETTPGVTLPDGSGRVIGSTQVVPAYALHAVDSDIAVAGYRGIPYAHPPVGERRWRAPVALDRLPVDPYPARTYGAASPQQPTTARRIAWHANPAARPPPGSEDCLYLNIWSPVSGPGAKLPVMVWIHGGGFVRGTASTPSTDGAWLAAHGVVVVTFNYRTGPLGFFHHDAFAAEPGPKANFGLLDQIAALRWIKRNITAFGGDADRVTLFGSSAGGASVLCLMLSPLIAGEALFHRAIVQSGGGAGDRLRAADPAAPQDRETAASLGARFYGSLDRSAPAANPEGRPELAGLTLAEVEARYGMAAALRHGVAPEQLEQFFGTSWNGRDEVVRPEFRQYPFLDGEVVAHCSALAGFRAAAQADVPLLIGYDSDEASVVFGLGQQPGRQWAQRFLDGFGVSRGFSYDDLHRLYRTRQDAELAALLYRDLVFGLPAQMLAGLHAARKSHPAWLYQFGYTSSRSRHGQPDRAGHSAEVAYLFGRLPEQQEPPGAAPHPGRALDATVSGLLVDYWINFAAHGDPNAPHVLPNLGSAVRPVPSWPRYDAARRNVLLLDNGGRLGGLQVKTVDGLNDERSEVIRLLFAGLCED